jgi:signal peptidase I
VNLAAPSSMRFVAKLVGWVVCSLVAIAAVSTIVFPLATGGTVLTVLTGSMTPRYPVGALIYVQPVDPATLGPDDVITFQTSPDAAVVTHRVVRVEFDQDDALQFVTKGDANANEDPFPAPAAGVQGSPVFTLPYAGYVREALQSPLGFGTLAGILLVAVLIDRRRQRTSEDADPEPVAPASTAAADPRPPLDERQNAPDVLATAPTRPSLGPPAPQHLLFAWLAPTRRDAAAFELLLVRLRAAGVSLVATSGRAVAVRFAAPVDEADAVLTELAEHAQVLELRRSGVVTLSPSPPEAGHGPARTVRNDASSAAERTGPIDARRRVLVHRSRDHEAQR